MIQPLWYILRQLLKKLSIDLPYDPAILLLDIYSKRKQDLKEMFVHP